MRTTLFVIERKSENPRYENYWVFEEEFERLDIALSSIRAMRGEGGKFRIIKRVTLDEIVEEEDNKEEP